MSALFGVSALYHRVTWTTPARRRMRRLAWTSAPRWLGGTVYLALGWVAAVYALRRPDPVPVVFGYHEVFHLLVIAGVATTSWPSACTPCHPANPVRLVDRAGEGPSTVVGRRDAARFRRR